jgi:hypothetical protein
MKPVSYFVVAFALSAVLYFAGRGVPAFADFAASVEWALVAFGYAGLAVALYAWSYRAMAGSPRAMVNAVNGSTAVKMLVVLSAITLYLVAGGVHRVQFALGLFAVFAAHSALFVAIVLRKWGQ